MTTTIDLSKSDSANWTPSKAQCEQWIASAFATADFKEDCLLSLRFVDTSESQSLNKSYRDKDYPTNVLSFPANIPVEIKNVIEQTPLGDIALCAEIVEKESLEQNKPLAAHWAHLLIHGSLHLLGFDHETEIQANAMESLEIKAVVALGFDDPYKNLS